MVIWRGWGILAAVLLFGGLVVAQLIADAVGGEGTYSSNTLTYGGIGLAVGGAFTFGLALWLDRRNPPRPLVDPSSGEEVIAESRNDLFFIPMRVWGLVGVIGGAAMAVAGLIGLG